MDAAWGATSRVAKSRTASRNSATSAASDEAAASAAKARIAWAWTRGRRRVGVWSSITVWGWGF